MPPLVILLHGVRATGSDMTWLAGALSQHLPEARFVQPDAPFADDESGVGRMWFSTRDITAETRAARVAAARPAFDAALSGLLAAEGHPGLGRVALVGFSQGAIMALDAVASGRWPVAACVGFSGRLACSPAAAPVTPILLVHGVEDGVVPPAETRRAARVLRDAGADLRQVLLPGLGHMVSAEGARRAGRFLARHLASGVEGTALLGGCRPA